MPRWITILAIAGVAGCSAQSTPPDGATPDLQGADTTGPDLFRYWKHDVEVADSALGSGPPYPLVLVHGFFGWDKIGPLTYFYDVKQALESDGHQVVVASMDPFNSTSIRGNQLLQQVQVALVKTGAAKVNLVAHSQGGLDARYVASVIPERIGAVFTVSTPHMGAHIADVLLQRAPGFTVELAKAFFKAVGRPVYGDVAEDADLKACLESLTTDSVDRFNRKYPDHPLVSYYSIAGRSGSALAEEECFAPKAPPFITKLAKHVDPIDALLYLNHKVVGGSLLDPEPNDGVVRVDSTKWGTWLGCVPADHWDEIGQLFGDSPGKDNPFDHVELYRDVAKFLVSRGF